MTGTWMQVMAQNWLMTNLTHRATMLGLVNFATGLPMVALVMVGGLVADRYDKRRILLITQLVQMVLALGVGWLVAHEQIRIWHVAGVAFLLGISNSFEMPAAAAMVPELVPKAQVGAAIAIERSTFHGTRLLGPALAGYAVGRWGTASAFFINALSFVALIIALFTIQAREKGTAEEERQRRGGMKQGIAYVRSDRPTLAMIGLMALTTVFIFPVMIVLLPLYARDVLHLGPTNLGWLMGISSVGSFGGSLGLLAIRRERRRGMITAAAAGAALALANLSLAHGFSMAAGSLIVLSLSVSTLVGLANIIVQERAPTPLRGRVSAIAALSFFGLMPFAGLGITGMADGLGMPLALRLAASAYFCGAVAVLLGPGRHLVEKPEGAKHQAIYTSPRSEGGGGVLE